MAFPGRIKGSWAETANADNDTATATRTAPSGGLSHYVTSISAGYDATASGALLTLKEDTTEIGRWYVYDSMVLSFSSPIKLSPGTAAELELAASGTGGEVGAVVMTGDTY